MLSSKARVSTSSAQSASSLISSARNCAWLGVQNDLATERQVLQQILDRAPPELLPELSRSAGFLEGWSARGQEKASRKLAKKWARFESTQPFWVSE